MSGFSGNLTDSRYPVARRVPSRIPAHPCPLSDSTRSAGSPFCVQEGMLFGPVGALLRRACPIALGMELPRPMDGF